MISKIKQLFGVGPKTDYAQLVKDGAIILDVRTKNEFSSGHIPGSINISVNELKNHLKKLGDKNKPIITCCASGIRSAAAKNLLVANGFQQVYNGGGWSSLQNKLN